MSDVKNELREAIRGLKASGRRDVLATLLDELGQADKEDAKAKLNVAIGVLAATAYAHGMAWIWLTGTAASFAMAAATILGFACAICLAARFG